MAEAGTSVAKYPGTHLFRQGEAADACYIVTDGEAELYRDASHGRSVVGRHGPGSVVGDIAMFQERPYLSSARAVSHVRAIRLERRQLVPLLLSRPVIAVRWLVNGLSQLEATQLRLLRLMDRTVVERVAGILVDERDGFGIVEMSQASIAELLGVSRQSVNEALRDLKERGAIDTGYRHVRIIDEASLLAVAPR